MRRIAIVLALLVVTATQSVALHGQSAPRGAAAQGPKRAPAPKPKHNTLTAAERAAGWQLLFDGRTTSGWRGYLMDTIQSGWKVVDGALTRVAPAGDIITTRQFDNNWELQLDWKTEPKGNSGIFFDVIEDSAHAMYESGPEFQILDNESYLDVMTSMTMTGANYALHAPAKDVRKPLGQWNHVRLIVRGDHVEHWMNGVKLLAYELGSADWLRRKAESKFKNTAAYGSARRGYIGLQEHDGMIAFRNIKLRKLTAQKSGK